MSGRRLIAVFLAAVFVAGGFVVRTMAEEPSAEGAGEPVTRPAAVEKQGSEGVRVEVVEKESTDRTRGARSQVSKEFRPSLRVPAGDAVSFPVDI